MRVLMVCLGNICRSPIAEGVLRHKASLLGLDMQVDSAGTIGFHAMSPPHPQSIACLKKQGVDIRDLKSRKIEHDDLDAFDYILCMDRSNVSDVMALCNHASQKNKIHLIRDYSDDGLGLEVPDPYGMSDEHFEEVSRMLHRAIDGFIARTTT
ncbi:MAG: low molecular weight protein-tyrosine-phosphatase [Flavobacteriales bacterium]